MFLILIAAVVTAAGIHVARLADRSVPRAGEVLLRWVLVGYCGVPMLIVAGVALLQADHVADVLGFAEGNPFQTFLSWAYLGMALVATLAVRWGGVYLIGPALVWAVFFTGATGIHLGQASSHGGLLVIFATHGLISVLLLAGLIMSGLLARRT